jgi:ribonuclease HII
MITVGIDEVGRGCWAGPLVAGAAILREPIAGLADSKVLTKARRELLSAEIYEKAFVGLGWVTPSEVDELGLTQAVRVAMQRAIAEITVNYDRIIIDGSYNFFADDDRAEAFIKADGSVPCVSAASIVAKVARDAYMANEVHKLHPEYGFDRHVGYGTKAHLAALKLHGISPQHRTSYKPIQALLTV